MHALEGVGLLKVRPAHLALHRASQTRRVRRGSVRVVAGGEEKKLQNDLKETNKALAQAGEALQSHLADLSIERERWVLVSTQQAELWARQEALYRRENERWDAERAFWTQREATLLSQLTKLQDALVELALAKGSSIPSPSNAGSTGPELPLGDEAAASTGTAEANSGSTSAGDGVMHTSRAPAHRKSSIIDEAAHFAPPGSDVASKPSQPYNDAPKPDEAEVRSLEQSLLGELSAAFRAVEEADVMSPEFDTLAGFQQYMDNNNLQIAAGQTTTGSQRSSGESGNEEGMEPPTLALGSDDIFWVSQLHGALMQASFYPGEEDIEDWVFGQQTLSALLTFQASAGLPETGLVDAATWAKLLGKNYRRIAPPNDPESIKSSPGELSEHSAASLQASSMLGLKAARELSEQKNQDRLMAAEMSSRNGSSNGNGTSKSTQNNGAGTQSQFDKWPVLREGDGGVGVHKLHIALEQHGFVADEDDQRWWFFGSSTHSAVMTMQACSGLPESGVTDARTWLAMMGQGTEPSALENLVSQEHEDDLSGDGNAHEDKDAVWLIGEQRWERRKKMH